MSEPMTILTRTSPLMSTTRFRSRLNGDPKFFGLDSTEAVRKYNGNLPTGATTLYTCPNWKRAVSMPGIYSIFNPTAGAIAFDFHHVPSGGTVATSNRLATITIASYETRTITTGALRHVIMSGDSLVINPGTLGLNAWGIFHEERVEAAAWIGGFVGGHVGWTSAFLVCPATRTLVIQSVLQHNTGAGATTALTTAAENGGSQSATAWFARNAALAASGELEYDIRGHIAYGEGGACMAYSSPGPINTWVNAILL